MHPGEILLEDFMKPLGLSARALARALHVPHNRLLAITAGKRAITADTALRLARHFGGDAGWWLRLQARHDLEVAERDQLDRIASEVRRGQTSPAPPDITPLRSRSRAISTLCRHLLRRPTRGGLSSH